jgi:hypothetical protein
MKTLILCLALTVPVFGQSASMANDDVNHIAPVLNVKTCTMADLQENPQQFMGYQTFDNGTLASLRQGLGTGDWKGWMYDDPSDARIDVLCEPELAKRIRDEGAAMKKYARRWHVIVGEDGIHIVQIELCSKDGYIVKSIN